MAAADHGGHHRVTQIHGGEGLGVDELLDAAIGEAAQEAGPLPVARHALEGADLVGTVEEDLDAPAVDAHEHLVRAVALVGHGAPELGHDQRAGVHVAALEVPARGGAGCGARPPVSGRCWCSASAWVRPPRAAAGPRWPSTRGGARVGDDDLRRRRSRVSREGNAIWGGWAWNAACRCRLPRNRIQFRGGEESVDGGEDVGGGS